ncbi:hypothetical protein A1Q1_00727 [Trichosporon asahii var. asahii CBS 2479]|uniref:Carboxymethylenebutenolidase n=1 Tax=Trichosporon asahii var. asahii (strain ATCC 90039 / CBS 2479 / JCM 2466 / KCTC 7840 / NBRC 103889/ NCYC 2677 / UAMH 7654) TaxID=1186058 RepID=J6F4A8_TRIAS|nr:hypothetical protein A1Q1_00727 [Trichosporon asahii var. asahii CBS 2479]EJT50072.1 hypothetical protein A1Q1_00727 [Trichosporon asahii var. asahii CBS 2479]
MTIQYDPQAESERPVRLPDAPIQELGPGIKLQPPLSRRGHGPGVIAVLPSRLSLRPHAKCGLKTPLDPDPVQKWAEEGFAVVGVQLSANSDITETLAVAIAGLESCPDVDNKGRYAVLVYDPSAVESIVASMPSQPALVALIVHGSSPSWAPVPVLAHLPGDVDAEQESDSADMKICSYGNAESSYFVVPSAGPKAYSPTDAAIAHTRSLVFLRERLGGPYFDLEQIWEEHTHYEFVDRSVSKTMGTMVAEPYVNHVPTMTGGVGREALFEFYRDHFIFSNPDSAELTTVSRTIGADRVVDEFIYSCTHDRMIDWLLPGVPPSGSKLRIPMIAVVNIRGDRLYHEHIWWDQATALQQAGFLPTYVPTPQGKLRLPVGGNASADMLLDETAHESNEMFGPDWGVQP